MAFLWDTVWTDASSTELAAVADWLTSDPLVETQNQGGLQNLDDLGTAIIIALFTDAKLPDHLIDSYGFTKDDQHEWHGNTFDIDDQEEILGSMLWTLERAPLNQDTARMAEHYAAQALQTLVRQKKVSAFDVSSWLDKAHNRITLRIIAYAGNERTFYADLYPLR